MILRKIIIKNYRQFRDVDITFDNLDDKNITMILGGNGAGKTNFLNAISWCLYGSEIHDLRDSTLDLCNKKAENIALIGDEIEVKVELEFLDREEIFGVNRVWGFIKGKDGLRRNYSLDRFELKTIDGNEIHFNDAPYYVIESKFPKEIGNYFLFDETQVNEYFDQLRLESLKDAILSLTQINLIARVNSNIQKVKENYIRRQKDISPKLGKVNERINELENNIRISTQNLKQTEKELGNIMDEIEKIEEELINKNSKDISNAFLRNKKLDMRISSNSKKLSDLENKLEQYVLLKYPYIISYNSILRFIELSGYGFDNKYVPKNVRFFIKDLLENGECVCGADLSSDMEHRRALEDFLENTIDAPDYVENYHQILEYIKNVIIEDIKNFKSNTLEYHREISSLKYETGEFIEEKRGIEALLNANPVEEINRLVDFRKDLVEDKTRLESKINHLKYNIEKDYSLLGKQRKLLSRQDQLYMEYITQQKKIELCEGVSISTDYLYASLTEDLRVKIQNFIKEYLILSHWKEGQFVDLMLDENFNVKIKNNYGNFEGPSDLSDGEKTVLALCFVCALHNISGFDLPIIMDVSFSYLDSESRKNLINSLPEIIGDIQLIFLSKNEEYTTNLHNHIGKEYKISKNSSAEGIESEVD